ncbi:hypothetical protein [Flavobacterium geliluteum]|uniref:DUF4296 domain-containing protein n=1 Tax=Flavobacterium geliluteum TaxID=2816120 RepID=A0A940X524_9FLAO|nr:hypothetical protein [Flavobacterium geliluteum]MBP4137358.1 hypothetical protein [Flavobacterium geliluteum]
MKKTLLILFIIFASCAKKELPSNVSIALNDLDGFIKINRDYDSLISILDESKINGLSIDSLNSIIVRIKVNREMLQEREYKVEEFLKYNPKYSDYDEIKNRKTIPVIDINENYDLILKRYTALKIKNKIYK